MALHVFLDNPILSELVLMESFKIAFFKFLANNSTIEHCMTNIIQLRLQH